jgi:hypothetical protein
LCPTAILTQTYQRKLRSSWKRAEQHCIEELAKGPRRSAFPGTATMIEPFLFDILEPAGSDCISERVTKQVVTIGKVGLAIYTLQLQVRRELETKKQKSAGLAALN